MGPIEILTFVPSNAISKVCCWLNDEQICVCPILTQHGNDVLIPKSICHMVVCVGWTYFGLKDALFIFRYVAPWDFPPYVASIPTNLFALT